jgi:hypothetical protein
MTSRIEELARANLKPTNADPCTLWDDAVSWRMATYGENRLQAVDRLLATHSGSDLWQRCCSWDARQPKILPDGTKSGNWLNNGDGTGIARRIPRNP